MQLSFILTSIDEPVNKKRINEILEVLFILIENHRISRIVFDDNTWPLIGRHMATEIQDKLQVGVII